MAMTQKTPTEPSDDATTEVIAALKQPVTTIEALQQKYLATVAASNWRACCWPERMTDGSRLVISGSPSCRLPEARHRAVHAVLVRACGERLNRGLLRRLVSRVRQVHLGAAREMLPPFGLAKARETRNFQKQRPINSVRQSRGRGSRDAADLLRRIRRSRAVAAEDPDRPG